MSAPSGEWNGGHGDGTAYGKGLHVLADDLGVIDAGKGETVPFALRPTWQDEANAATPGEIEAFLGRWAAFLDEYGDAA